MRDRKQNTLDRGIVRCLQRLKSFSVAVPTAMLCNDLYIEVIPTPTRAEVEESLRYLEEERRIVGLNTETGPKWKLTDEGQLWAAEQRI